MSLIKCIECGNEISDKSKVCIHCGCPTSESLKSQTDNPNLDNNIINQFLVDGNIVYAIKYVKDNLNISLEDATKYVKDFKINNNIISKNQQNINLPKCPTCQSTNIRKIGAGERAASVLGLGIFSKKINKTWKCNNCGHTW